MQKEILQNAEILIKNKVDFIILEVRLSSSVLLLLIHVLQYFRNVEEIVWAIECLRDCKKPLFASLCIGPRGDSAGVDPGEYKYIYCLHKPQLNGCLFHAMYFKYVN